MSAQERLEWLADQLLPLLLQTAVTVGAQVARNADEGR